MLNRPPRRSRPRPGFRGLRRFPVVTPQHFNAPTALMSDLMLRLVFLLCDGFVTARTSVPILFCRDVTSVTAQKGGEGVSPGPFPLLP